MKSLELRLFLPCSKVFTKSTSAIFEVYVAFPPALSWMVWRVSPPQHTTNSTSLSKLVWEMCWWARKWVQWIRALIAIQFCNHCCSPTFWNWLIMDLSFFSSSICNHIQVTGKKVHSLWTWFHLSRLLPVSEWFGPINPLKRSSTLFFIILNREKFLPSFCVYLDSTSWLGWWFKSWTWAMLPRRIGPYINLSSLPSSESLEPETTENMDEIWTNIHFYVLFLCASIYIPHNMMMQVFSSVLFYK